MNSKCLTLIVLVLVATIVAFVMAAIAATGVDRVVAIGLALFALAALLKALCCECRPRQTTPGTVGQTRP